MKSKMYLSWFFCFLILSTPSLMASELIAQFKAIRVLPSENTIEEVELSYEGAANYSFVGILDSFDSGKKATLLYSYTIMSNSSHLQPEELQFYQEGNQAIDYSKTLDSLLKENEVLPILICHSDKTPFSESKVVDFINSVYRGSQGNYQVSRRDLKSLLNKHKLPFFS